MGEVNYVMGVVELKSDAETKSLFDILNSGENRGKFLNA